MMAPFRRNQINLFKRFLTSLVMKHQAEPVSLSLIFALLILHMIFTSPSERIDQRVFAQRRQETERGVMFRVAAVWFSVNVSIVRPSFDFPLSPSLIASWCFPSCPLQTTKVKLEVDDSGEISDGNVDCRRTEAEEEEVWPSGFCQHRCGNVPMVTEVHTLT